MSGSITPYLIRAVYEWCCDSAYAPLIVVKDSPAAILPRAYIREGEITLNIGPTAVKDLHMGNDGIQFSARFGGVAQDVWVPIGHIAGIFARETGQGMNFVVDLQAAPPHPLPEEPKNPTGNVEEKPSGVQKPSLKVLK